MAGRLSVPPARPGAVSRAGLIGRARASGARVVGVTAPAGYGKSTMLAEWAAIEKRGVAWVSCAAAVDDPAAMLRLLAAACTALSPQVAAVASEMPGVGGFTLGRSAPLLAAALAATEAPFVVFVDDVHAVGSADCRDVLDVVLGGVPGGSQVVLAGRHQQPYIARLRAAGDLWEVTADDLVVDAAGAAQIFEAAGVLDASPEDVAAACERCEGWPTGVFLCALIARDGGHLAAAGTDRFVADYLYQECLERASEVMQRFLRRTAVLEQFSAELCDAVLDTTDAQTRLNELEASNLFLVPMDRHRGWYRYHTLFREFLLAELHRAEPGQAAELHRRAGSWYEDNGVLTPAIEHRLAADDRERAARLVAAVTLPMYRSGQVGVVERWLDRLGYDAVARYPPLAMFACWVALLLGKAAAAERWADLIERVDVLDGPTDEVREFMSARALIRAAMCVDGPQRALEDARFAVEREPRWSPWRDQAMHLYGMALVQCGDVSAARVAFAAAAADTAPGNPGAVVLCESQLAVLAIDEGDWQQAATHAETALRVAASNHMEAYATTALAQAVSARIALRDGDVVRAERLLAQGMRARTLSTYVLPYLALRVRQQLAQAFVMKGDRVAGGALLREMHDVLRVRPDVGVPATEITALRRELETLPDRAGTLPLSAAELRVLPYLQTHLTLREIAERLFLSRSTVNSQVASLYRKLGVHRRDAAVRRAAEVGLLG